VKYVGLLVKVLPEAVFEAKLGDSRRRMQAWGAAQGPEAKRRLEEGQSELATTREVVEVARAAWLALPDGGPRQRTAEKAYVEAMRRKDEATRRVADLTLGAIHARASERL
jgi:hypothetical protein